MTNGAVMIRHYIKIAFRNLVRNPVFSFINILGLALGMAVCLVIYQYISFELSFDRFHTKHDKIYRVVQTAVRDNVDLSTDVFNSYGLGVLAKQDIPEVEAAVRTHLHYDGPAVVSNPLINKPFKEEDLLFADKNFLNVFDFKLIRGGRNDVLNDKFNVVLTESMAVKYFGHTEVMGKILQIDGDWVSGNFTVTGIMEDVPKNSHLRFDFVVPIEALLDNAQYLDDNGWGWSNFVTYVMIDPSGDLEQVGRKFDQLIENYNGEALRASDIRVRTTFQALDDIHLRSNFDGDPVVNNGSILYVNVFSLIALFILIMAWVNYINLSTARSLYRAKEVGIKKSIGARKKQLVGQFMTESLIINLVAGMLSIAVAMAIIPIINNIISGKIELSVLQDWRFWSRYSLLLIVGSIFTGSYPAFVLASFKPLSVFKITKPRPKNKLDMRRSLIVFQFLVSVLLMSGSYLVYDQVTFMKDQDLGIDMERIVIVHGPSVGMSGENIGERLQSFKNEVLKHHAVLTVSGSQMVPAKGYNWGAEIREVIEPRRDYHVGYINFVDKDFVNTYGLELLGGKGFLHETSTLKAGVIINEEALRVYGLGSIEEALTKKLEIGGESFELPVAGVVSDFGWHSLKQAQSPYMFALENRSRAYFSVKMEMADVRNSMEHIERSYNLLFPGNPFNYFFLDDEFNSLYQSEVRFGNLFFAFTLLAIFIACLGLFSLVSYSVILRVKEIGIRKVLGAGKMQLLALLNREYLILLLVANLVAIPLIFFGGNHWLDNFAVRVNMGLELIFIPPVLLLLISFLTVSYRTYVAVSQNPVKALRNE